MKNDKQGRKRRIEEPLFEQDELFDEEDMDNVTDDTLEFLSLDDETIAEYEQKQKAKKAVKKTAQTSRRTVYAYEDEEYEDEEYEDAEYGDEEYEDAEYEDEEYEDAEYEDEEYEDEYEDEEEDEEYEYRSRKGKKSSRRGRKYSSDKSFNALDAVVAVLGVIVLIGVCLTGGIYANAKSIEKQVEAFATMGEEIDGISVIGESGLLAVSESAKLSGMMQPPAEEGAEPGQTSEGTAQEQKYIEVDLHITSILSDMKIKFVNRGTGKLIGGVPFEVSVSGGSKSYDLKDDDKDGIIYQTGVANGTYQVTIKPLTGSDAEKYRLPSSAESVTVTDKIAYKEVEVADEVKTEAEVNVAAEDTAVQDTVVESVLTDTVEWVESTKTPIDSDDNYVEVQKSDIPDPATISKGNGTFAKFAAFTPYTNPGDGNTSTDNDGTSTEGGNTGTEGDNAGTGSDNTDGNTTQTPADTPSVNGAALNHSSLEMTVGDTASLDVSGGIQATVASWDSSDSGVATVSGGTVTAVAEGTATITAKVTAGIEETVLSCTVTVKKKEEDPQPPQPQQTDSDKLNALNPSLSSTSLSMKTGETQTLSVGVNSSESHSIAWNSSNSSVASVTSGGTVTAVAKGQATITATVTVGNASLSLNCAVSVADSGPTAISITGSTTVEVGKTGKVTGTTTPAGGTVTWKSSDERIAKIASDGTITGVAEGKVTITGTCGNVSGTWEVTVKKQVINYTAVTITGDTEITAGATGKVTGTTTPAGGTIVWTSSDEKIAKIASDGTITGVAEGKAMITGSCGNAKGIWAVTVKGNYTAVTITGDAEVFVGKTVKLVGTTTPAGGTVTWTSSDEKIAKIASDGTVTGIAMGKVTITGTCGKAKATKEIVVKSSAAADTKSKLKDKQGNQLFIKNAEGKYVEATYADYYKDVKFYLQKVASYRYTGWQTIDGHLYFFDKNGNFVTGDQVIQGAKYSFGSDGKLASSSGTMGIDVSKWNGSVDWNAVKNSGVSYVIIRCGYRGSSTGALIEDPKFKSNIQGAKAAGLKVGVYFFSQAINEVEAVEEASMALNLVKGYGLNYPIFLDVESSGGRGDKIDSGTRTAVCKAFCATVQNSGYNAGVYANKTWLEEKMDAPSLTSYKIWLAQYASSPTYSKTRYDMWQYSSKGQVSGISGKVDMNISYLHY